MSEEYVIRPDEIIVPELNVCELQTAAGALRSDGTGIAQLGNDIKSAWGGLEGNYIAPEADILLAAVNPVATAGDDFNSAISTVADALDDFAEEAGPIQARLRELKAEAVAFKAHIDANDDWREDEDKVEEFNELNDEILAKLNAYMAAERACANKITAIFGGTTFVAGEYGAEPTERDGRQVYGYTDVPEGVQTPWATPQEHDAGWLSDVGSGIWDFVSAPFLDAASMVGLYTEDGGWFDGNPIDNAKQYWGDTFDGVLSLVGVNGLSSAWDAWKEVAHSFVPWREWGDRPGYVITQGILNIGTTVAGVVLSATGVGAVVGAPLLAMRGSRILRALSGVRGDGPETPNAPNAPDAPNNPTDRSDLHIDQGPDRPGRDGGPSPDAELDAALDGLGIPRNQLDGLNESLDDAARLSELPDPPTPDTPTRPDTPDSTPSEPSRPDADTTPAEPTDRTPEPPTRDEPPAEAERPADSDRNDADTTPDGPDSETGDAPRTPDLDADADADQERRDADADASDPLQTPENLPTTRQIQELVERFGEDLDLADLAHPEGIIGELNDRQRELVNAGVPEGRAEMPIGDRPGGGSSPDLSPSARLDTPSGGGPSNDGIDLPPSGRGGTGTIDAPSGGSGPSGGGPDLPPGGRGGGPGGLPEGDGGSSDRETPESSADGSWHPENTDPAPPGYTWVKGDPPYVRRLEVRDDLPQLRWNWDKGEFQEVTGREREDFQPGTTREQAYDVLTRSDNSSLRKFVEVLTDFGLIDANNVDAAGRPIDILNAISNDPGADLGGRPHDYVRHFAKEQFREALVRHVLDQDVIVNDPRFTELLDRGLDADQAFRATSHELMLEASRDLASSDRGSLGEAWYQEMYASEGHSQVRISREQASQLGFQLEGNRRIDFVEVRDVRGVESGRVIEIKNVTTRLGDREERQIRDLLNIPGNEINVPGRNDPLPIRSVRVAFPDPRGTLSNATFLADFLEERRGAPIEIEIHGPEGLRRTLRANQESIDFLRNRTDLKEWLGLDGE
ncbi:hypothetical protein [Marinactinospora rubrisoli]|uniref:Uncharacterized protein n=1 Tax=Marinactinospora rubrisoli TaxID=2715399 RepID=A0ABW2KGB9_9ACTN